MLTKQEKKFMQKVVRNGNLMEELHKLLEDHDFYYVYSDDGRVYDKGKAPTVTTCGGGHREPKVYVPPLQWRKLTPLEVERLQTVPNRYTKCGQKENGDMVEISNTQRYKMLGNGFTINVIAHIIKNL